MKIRDLVSILDGMVSVISVDSDGNEKKLWFSPYLSGLQGCPENILNLSIDTMVGVYDGDFAGIVIFVDTEDGK